MVAVESIQTVVQVPVDRLWAAMQDANSLLPKVMPEMFNSVETIEGDGGSPGSIRVLKFGPALPMVKFMKEKLEAIDETNHTVVTSIIEGGFFGIAFSLYKVTISYVPSPEGCSTTVNWSVEYEPLIAEPPVEESKQGAARTFQAIEAYLLSNNEASKVAG